MATTSLRGVFGLLRRNPAYRRLFLATVISMFGDWFAFVAISGFVTDTTGRPGSSSLVFAANMLPVFLVSPLAGIVADRVSRRRLMVTVDLLRVVPALGLLLALRWGSVPLALGGMAVIAALSSFFDPVSEASVPNIVEPEDLSLAQAVLDSMWGTMLFVGAALGGVATLALGREVSLWINATTFLVSALLVGGIRQPLQEPHRRGPAGVGAQLRELWTRVKKSRPTRALLLNKLGLGVSNGTVGLLPAFATSLFSAGDAGVGLLLAARGLGSLIGPYLGRAWARDDGRRLLVACGVSLMVYGLGYLLLPLSPSLPLAAAFVVLAHLGGGAQWVLSTYGLQVVTPDRLRGRVLGMDFSLTTLAIGLSSLAAGAATEHVGLTRVVGGLAVASLGYGAVWLGWTWRLWRARENPLSGPR